MSRLAPTLASLVLVGVMALASRADVAMVAATVLVVQTLIATAPGPRDPGGVAVRSPQVVTAGLACLVATTVTLEPDLLSAGRGSATHVIGADGPGLFAAVVPAVAVAVLTALVAQMLRRDGRADLVGSTAHAVTIAVLAVLAVGWIGAMQSFGGWVLVVAGAAGVMGGLLVWTLPGDRWVLLSCSTIAGGVAGAGVILVLESNLTWFFGTLVGSAAGVVAVLGQVVGRAWGSGQDHPAARWGLPGAMAVAFAGPVVLVGGRLI